MSRAKQTESHQNIGTVIHNVNQQVDKNNSCHAKISKVFLEVGIPLFKLSHPSIVNFIHAYIVQKQQ